VNVKLAQQIDNRSEFLLRRFHARRAQRRARRPRQPLELVRRNIGEIHQVTANQPFHRMASGEDLSLASRIGFAEGAGQCGVHDGSRAATLQNEQIVRAHVSPDACIANSRLVRTNLGCPDER